MIRYFVLFFEAEPERQASAESELDAFLRAVKTRTLDVTEQALQT